MNKSEFIKILQASTYRNYGKLADELDFIIEIAEGLDETVRGSNEPLSN